MKVSAAKLKRFFNAKRIAVIGGREAEKVIMQTLALGFDGEIYAASHSRDSMQGIVCVNQIDLLPNDLDAVFIAIPNTAAIEAVAALREKNCAGVVCYSSGFAESENSGGDLQSTLQQQAGDMALVGPNCYGYIDYANRICLWPDYHGGIAMGDWHNSVYKHCYAQSTNQSGGLAERYQGIGIITQSGNVGINITMQKRGLPLAYMVSIGNQAGLSIADYIRYFADSEHINAVGIYLESIVDLNDFLHAVSIAHAKKMPIVCLKTGRSKLAASALKSHTSAIAGDYAFYQSFFTAIGVASVDSLEVFLETLKLLFVHRQLAQASFLSISSSGGEASQAADYAKQYNVDMPSLTEQANAELCDVLGDEVSIQNPLDYHTYIWGDKERQSQCFKAAHQSQQAITCKILDFPIKNDDANEYLTAAWYNTLTAFIDAVKNTDKPAAVVSLLPENMPPSVMTQCYANGIVPLCGLSTAIASIKAAASVNYCAENIMLKQRALMQSVLFNGSFQSANTQTLNEYQAKDLCHSLGIAIPKNTLLSHGEHKIDDQVRNANLQYPIVAKACHYQLMHKTEANALRLNIENLPDLHLAIKHLSSISEQILVEEMVTEKSIEMVLRIKKDALFGFVISIGFGGVLIELLADMVHIVLPSDKNEIKQALKKLKFYTLLSGYRNQHQYNIEALVSTIFTVQQKLLSDRQYQQIEEVEINPLLVCVDKVIAVDALARINKE